MKSHTLVFQGELPEREYKPHATIRPAAAIKSQKMLAQVTKCSIAGMALCPSTEVNDQFAAPGMSVFLVADNRLLRETVARLLRKRALIRLAGASRDSGLAWEEISASCCGVVLAECSTLRPDAKLISDLFLHLPQIKVVVFGMDEDPDIFLRYASFGVSGYLLKDASAAEIIAAIRGVIRGEAVCPPKLCMSLIRYVSSRNNSDASELSSRSESRRPLLTHRQFQLLNLVAKGLTNKEIGTTLNLSEFTVKNHMRRIMRRVEAGNRQEAVQLIRATGLLQV
jgi:DNA-binding NarL/FixJ family response regulator